jgi:CubicO group peptidase (beta-lactamase class C family)
MLPATILTATLLSGGAQDALVERLESICEAYLEEARLAGLSLVIELEGEPLLARGFGMADAEHHEIASAESLYRADGLQHAMLATAALSLAEDGKLELADAVSQHLAGFAREEPLALRDLLAHTSGLPELPGLAALLPLAGKPDEAAAAARARALEQLSAVGLEAPPRTCVKVSAANTLLLGLALEQAGGVPCDEVFRRVFAPAGMADTSVGPEGLVSSAADLVRWQRALANGALAGSGGREALAEEEFFADGTGSGRSLAFALVRLGDHIGLHAASFGPEASVCIVSYAEPSLTLAFCAGQEGVDLQALERRLARVLLGLPEPGFVDLPLEPAERARYAGSYFVGCTEYRVDGTGPRLVVHMPEGESLELSYQGEQRFRGRTQPEMELVFELAGERAVAFQLTGPGISAVARRIQDG